MPNTNRLAQCISEGRIKRIDGFAVNFGREASVVTENIRHHGHINVARFKNRLAVIECLDLGEFVYVLLDQVS